MTSWGAMIKCFFSANFSPCGRNLREHELICESKLEMQKHMRFRYVIARAPSPASDDLERISVQEPTLLPTRRQSDPMVEASLIPSNCCSVLRMAKSFSFSNKLIH